LPKIWGEKMSRNIKEGSTRLRVLAMAIASSAMIVLAVAMHYSARPALSCNVTKSSIDTGDGVLGDRQDTVSCTGGNASQLYDIVFDTAKYSDVNGSSTSPATITPGTSSFNFQITAKSSVSTSSGGSTITVELDSNHANQSAVNQKMMYLSDDKSGVIDTTTGTPLVTFTYHGPSQTGTHSTGDSDNSKWSTLPGALSSDNPLTDTATFTANAANLASTGTGTTAITISGAGVTDNVVMQHS
jgi:hypothetical protein